MVQAERVGLIQNERLKQELLSSGPVSVVIEEINREVAQNPAVADNLRWIGLSGSKPRNGEIGGEGGKISDFDLAFLFADAAEGDPLNMQAYEGVLDALNRAAQRMMEEQNVAPVFASTIRLEDAQMALARVMLAASGSDLQPVMVHSLIYTSPQAPLAFEPPMLTRNLFGQSLGLWGDDESALVVSLAAAEGVAVTDPNLTIGGLDGISDNFRMIRTNRHILPDCFLGPQGAHVLDYTMKWPMASVVEAMTGVHPGTWQEILDLFPRENGGDQVVALIERVREVRSQGDQMKVDEVEDLFREAIRLWPTLTNIRLSCK